MEAHFDRKLPSLHGNPRGVVPLLGMKGSESIRDQQCDHLPVYPHFCVCPRLELLDRVRASDAL